MSLPWFAFDIAAYVKDTMRLATEGHGAYLLLILDYYANEVPPPDDDEVLASIAKLPLEIWKAKHRKVLAPFFRIEGGFWHHDRIESEMREAQLKLSSSKARAVAGGLARWGKEGAPPIPPSGKRPHRRTKPLENASGFAQAEPAAKPGLEPKQSPAHAHTTLTLKNSLSTDRDAIPERVPQTGPVVEQHDPHVPSGIGTPIDPRFWPDPNHVAVCKIDGATDEIIQAEVAAFVAHKQESGGFSADWDASWSKWWKRWKEHQAKLAAKAKPRAAARVEVSGRFEPTAEQWDEQVARFAKNASHWSRQYGPEPGMGGCNCPPEILIRHGINPATGLKKWQPAPAKEPV